MAVYKKSQMQQKQQQINKSMGFYKIAIILCFTDPSSVLQGISSYCTVMITLCNRVLLVGSLGKIYYIKTL